MIPVTLNQFLALYSWFPLAVLFLFMALIARFYGKFSGNPVYYRLYVIPLILMGIATVRYTGIRRISGDMLADGMSALGGLMLCILAIRLYWLMIIKIRSG